MTDSIKGYSKSSRLPPHHRRKEGNYGVRKNQKRGIGDGDRDRDA